MSASDQATTMSGTGAIPKTTGGNPRSSTITLRGAFSSINGMKFDGQKEVKGRRLMKNLMNVEEIITPGAATTVIQAKIIRQTNVTEAPYKLRFEVDSTRRVVESWCECVTGRTANCKHGASLYLYINEERSEGKTDKQQEWTTPSKKLLERFPKGQTVAQIYGGKATSVRRVHIQEEGTDEVKILK